MSPANAPAGETASHADGLSTVTAAAQALSAESDPAVAMPTPSADASPADTPPLHEALGAFADTISSAMQTLADHVQAHGAQADDLSPVLQHVGAMADSAAAMVNDIAAAAMPALPPLPSMTETVDHVLDGTPLPELPAVSSVAQTADHALEAASLPELPAIPAVPQALDHVLGAGAAPDLPAIHTDVPASMLGAADAAVDHVAAPIVEAQPLQIGFLGQSYTEVHDPHDLGSHGMGSMLDGIV
jgi:hypothetical protein